MRYRFSIDTFMAIWSQIFNVDRELLLRYAYGWNHYFKNDSLSIHLDIWRQFLAFP